MVLARYTGWGLKEILELETDELVDWLQTIPKDAPGRGM
jgi:hypothetical protein